jgi:uncharacterized protein YjbI with pentapeptide repeats
MLHGFDIIQERNMVLSKWLIAFSIALLANSACAGQSIELQRLLETRACRSCALSGLNIGLYDLRTVDLGKADLSKAYLVKTNFHGANLSNANLTCAYMNGARLSGVRLKGANFSGAELELVDFTGAIFEDVDFSEAYLLHAMVTQEQLINTRLCKTVMPDAIISNRDCAN